MTDTENDDDDLEAAAEKMAAHMDDLPEPPLPKLPQSRRYLRAAMWRFDEMVKGHFVGTGFVFHIIGVVTMLRSVPFALHAVDRRISAQHKAVVDQWWQRIAHAPEIRFIKRMRNTALKDAALKSTAVASSSYIGDGPAGQEMNRDYLVDHIDLGRRRDMLADCAPCSTGSTPNCARSRPDYQITRRAGPPAHRSAATMATLYHQTTAHAARETSR